MRKNNFLERLFPTKQDFYQMIKLQADASARVIACLNSWVLGSSDKEYSGLLQEAEHADQLRFDMEAKLIEAFSTPFDRQDIYSISNEMNKIVEYAKSTLLEIEAFELATDQVIQNLVNQLMIGTTHLVEAIGRLKDNPRHAQMQIRTIRQIQDRIEKEYLGGMALLFTNADPMMVLKYREVYHHIKDAGVTLGEATDTLHRIIVRLI